MIRYLALLLIPLATVTAIKVGYETEAHADVSVEHAAAPELTPSPYRDTLIAQADTAPLDARPAATANATAALEVATASTALPDPIESPAESASLLYKLYKAGHLVPAVVLALFFALLLAQRWIAWLRTGYRKLFVASVLAGLGMLAERAADGTTPNLMMLMGALGVAIALYVKGEGAPARA